MKKLFLLLFAGLLLIPSEISAVEYKSKKIALVPRPVRTPDQYYIGFYLNEYTGDMAITPVTSITNMTITLTGISGTYINTTVALNAGQSYTDSLAGYNEGTYILTLSTADGVIAQYQITVVAD